MIPLVAWPFLAVAFIAAAAVAIGLAYVVRLLALYVSEQLVPVPLRRCICGHHKSQHYSALKSCQSISCPCQDYSRDPDVRPQPDRERLS